MLLGDLEFFLFSLGWDGLPGVAHPQHPLPADASSQDVGHQADEPGTVLVEGVDQGQDWGKV